MEFGNHDFIWNLGFDIWNLAEMPKVKTHQGTAKRIKVTRKGKLIARRAGQDHFNSRESGKITKNKRRDLVLHKTHNKLKSLMPYK